MGATFAGRLVLEPGPELDNCRSRGFPTDWARLANRYECPLGTRSGTGHILMYRGDLDYLNQAGTLNAENDLVISDTTTARTLKNLHAVSTRCITPGYPNDPAAVHLVELADVRRLMRVCQSYLNPDSGAFYNVRQTPGGNYHPYSQSGLGAWDWSGLWADLWGLVNQDFRFQRYPVPALPAVPDGTPEGFDFRAWPRWDAVGYLLFRLGLALALDLLTDTMSLVKPGATQPGLAAAESNNLLGRMHDAEPIGLWLGTVPRFVSVYFRKQGGREGAFGDTPWVTGQADAAAFGYDATRTYGREIIFDDLPAVMRADAGGGDTCTNLADLSARTTARAAEFYRVRTGFQGSAYRKAYTGFLADFRPGEEVRSVAWQDLAGGDHGGGPLTVVDRAPYQPDSFAGWPEGGAGDANGVNGRPWHLGPPEQPWRFAALARLSSPPSATPPAGYDEYRLAQWDTGVDGVADMTTIGDPGGAGPTFYVYRPAAPGAGGTFPGAEVAIQVGFKGGKPVYHTVGPVPVGNWNPTGVVVVAGGSTTFSDVLTAPVGGVYLISGGLEMSAGAVTTLRVEMAAGSTGTADYSVAGAGRPGTPIEETLPAGTNVYVPICIPVFVSVAPCKFGVKVSNAGVNGLGILTAAGLALTKL